MKRGLVIQRLQAAAGALKISRIPDRLSAWDPLLAHDGAAVQLPVSQPDEGRSPIPVLGDGGRRFNGICPPPPAPSILFIWANLTMPLLIQAEHI